MVIRRGRGTDRGVLLWELVVAISLLAGVLFPLGLSIVAERKALRAGYYRALAIGLVDGEMEILAAGEWRAFPAGTHSYAWHSDVATNLPPGRLTLTVAAPVVRLEWRPERFLQGGVVAREVRIP